MNRLSFITFSGLVAFISLTAQADDGEATYNQACMACHMTGAAVDYLLEPAL